MRSFLLLLLCCLCGCDNPSENTKGGPTSHIDIPSKGLSAKISARTFEHDGHSYTAFVNGDDDDLFVMHAVTCPCRRGE